MAEPRGLMRLLYWLWLGSSGIYAAAYTLVVIAQVFQHSWGHHEMHHLTIMTFAWAIVVLLSIMGPPQ